MPLAHARAHAHGPMHMLHTVCVPEQVILMYRCSGHSRQGRILGDAVKRSRVGKARGKGDLDRFLGDAWP